MPSTITLGLSQIMVGPASKNGTMPENMVKIGKTYENTCKLTQSASDVTEHKEEGKSAPEIRKKSKKMPILVFSIMNADVAALINYVGGENVGTEAAPVWGFNGDEDVDNCAIQVQSEQGLWVDIPNGDIDAVINADFSAKGIFLLDVTVTPCAVDSGKAIKSYKGDDPLTVDPTTLSFTSDADATGETITATSTGNVTYAAGPSEAEWLTVTKNAKVVTVKVSANTNGEARTANVTIIADGKTAVVPVTQAGA
jgi:hypothetical protein